MAKQQRDVGKESFWRSVFERQASSGLSARAFCRREKLSEASFYAWRRRIAARDETTAVAKAPLAFLPAVIRDNRLPDESITLQLAGGRVLRLPASFSVARLVELVEALESRAER